MSPDSASASVSSAEDQLKQHTALLSVGSSGTLVGVKLGVGLLMRSISVLAESAHSGLDLVAAVIAFLSLRKAAQPADSDHPFGHAKYESLGAAIEGFLILVASAGIVFAAGQKIHQGLHTGDWEMHLPLAGASVMVLSVILNLLVSKRLFKVGRQTDSVALESDAWHLLSDVYTSLAVLAGMLVIYVGERLGVRQLMILDPLIALVIAVMVARAGWSVTRRAVGHLLDAAIPPDQQRAITALLDEHYPQFVEYHALRSRKAGSQTFIDLHLVVPPNLPVLDAHDLADHLEQDIRLLVANAEVMIHVEPGPLGRADSSKEEETE